MQAAATKAATACCSPQNEANISLGNVADKYNLLKTTNLSDFTWER